MIKENIKNLRFWYYCGIALCGIVVSNLAYPCIRKGFEGKFLWSFGFILLGYSMYGFQIRIRKMKDTRKVKFFDFIYDLITLILVASIVIFICYSRKEIFCFITASFSFIGGYLHNHFWKFVKDKLKIPDN